MKLSIQLYSLREFMSFSEMLQYCKSKGLAYLEPAGLYGLKAADIVRQINGAKLEAQSFHFALEVLEEQWEELAEELPKCGARDFVMPFADVNNLAELRVLAAKLQDLALKLKAKGVKLHYHNHSHEIRKIFAGKSFLDQLLDLAPDLFWQVDVGWVTAGGGSVVAYMEKWKSRISMLHIKDIKAKDDSSKLATKNIDGVEVVVSAAAQKGGQPDAIGDGIVDFPAIFAKAKELAIDTFILENDNPVYADIFVDSGIKLVKSYMQ